MALRVLLLLAIVLAVLVALTLWRAARHEARAEAAYPPSGQLLEVNGTQVHADVMGEGPDLVMIHGASGNLRDFTFSLAHKLAEHYRVIVFDRPGLGYTDRINHTGATIRQQAELLRAAAQQLGADRPLVLGQSYGGAVALAWAVYEAEHIAGLIPVAAPSHRWSTGLDRFYTVTSHPWIGPLVIPFLTAWVHDERVENALADIFAPQAVPQGYKSHIGVPLTLRRASLRANALQRAGLKEQITAMQALYAQITIPTEIVHGDEDTTVGLSIHSAKLVQAMPGANLMPLDGIGHMPHHVAEEAVIDAVHRAARRAGLR